MCEINGSDTRSSVTLDTPMGDLTLPFEAEITRIYRAYRTCYSKEPEVEPEISTTQQNELLMKYREHLRYAYSRVCWSDDLKEHKINELVRKYLDKFGMDRVISWLRHAQFIKDHMRHESALEHATFTVTFADVDRSVSHQLVRHRLASYSQQSQRWCSETDPEFVVPDSIRINEEASKIFADYVNQLPDIIAKLKALGIPNQDIRYLYPNAIKTRIVMTANWREWIHIWNERRCGRAGNVIRECMDSIYWMVVEDVPFIFNDVSPKCRSLKQKTGIACCPEDKPCPKFKDVGGYTVKEVDRP